MEASSAAETGSIGITHTPNASSCDDVPPHAPYGVHGECDAYALHGACERRDVYEPYDVCDALPCYNPLTKSSESSSLILRLVSAGATSRLSSFAMRGFALSRYFSASVHFAVASCERRKDWPSTLTSYAVVSTEAQMSRRSAAAP